jgi:uncharacterized protein
VIAIDTNIAVYAHRPETSYAARSHSLIVKLAQGSEAWSIPMHCLHEFIAVVSNPKIWIAPSSPAQIAAQINAWTESPSFVPVVEDRGALLALMNLIATAAVAGGMVHDARIVSACLAAGVKTLLSVDRDLSRFTALRVVNPFA